MQLTESQVNKSLTAQASAGPGTAIQRLNNLSSVTRPVQALNASERSQNPFEHTSRLFNPYLAPTAVLIENKRMAQGSLSPSYQNNVAATKYMNVSAVPKVRAHTQTSLIA